MASSAAVRACEQLAPAGGRATDFQDVMEYLDDCSASRALLAGESCEEGPKMVNAVADLPLRLEESVLINSGAAGVG